MSTEATQSAQAEGSSEGKTGAARTGRVSSLAMLIAFAISGFLWMPGEFLSGDPHAWQEEARSILLTGELHVPQEVALKFGVPGQFFARNERNGLYYSKYGFANTLLALPPLWLQRALGGDIGTRLFTPSLFLFNLWYLAFGIVLAALLYRMTGAYSGNPAVRALFVLAAFFATSLWFYQRGQSSEIYQTIFFSAFFMALTGFLRSLRALGPAGLDAAEWRLLTAAWACAGALVFTRVIYGLMLPIVVLLAVWCASQGRPLRTLRPSAARLATALLLPPAVIVVLLGVVNHLKFGAPWLTGYHQWLPETHLPIGRLSDGLWGFLFSARFSIFFHFPLLVFALVGLQRFVERHRVEAIVIFATFIPFLLVLSAIPSWAGEWTYGPRYLLPMLPVLSLPFVTFADEIAERIATWRARAWAAIALAVLVYSGHLQVQVNRLPFFTYYHAREAMATGSLLIAEYFLYRHPGTIADDLVRNRDNLERLPYFPELRRTGPADSVEEYRRLMSGLIQRGNLYWTLPPSRRN